MEVNDLKKAGLKVTLPRVRILELLEQHADQHLSAEDIYRLLLDNDEDIGLATVYRVLTQFEAAGIVCRHQFEGGKAVFELISKGEHDHIVCVKSGVVEEFHDPIIQERIQKIAAEHGFEMTDHSLVIFGVKRKSQAV